MIKVGMFLAGYALAVLFCCCHGHEKHRVGFKTYRWGLQYIDHYTTVGFDPVGGSIEHQMANTVRFVGNKDTIVLPGARDGIQILHLPTNCGAELWGGSTKEQEFFGNDPHYSGPARMSVFLHEKIINEYNDGAFVCDGGIGSDNDVAYLKDLEFFCPTFQLCGAEVDIPCRMTIQLCGFARECRVFDSLKDYAQWRRRQSERHQIDLSYPCFAMEKTLFGEDGDNNNYCALFSGRVIRAERKVNDRTGEPFFWALVETMGNQEIDVVVHPMVVRGSPPKEGSILLGSFFLSGRLLPEETR